MNRPGLTIVRSAVPEESNKRSIKTVYYRDGTAVKVISAKYANTAVPRCIYHMQIDEYSAHYAEVYDTAGAGELHAIITRSVKGNIKIVFKREVDKEELRHGKQTISFT